MATISSMNVRMGLSAGGFMTGMQRAQAQVRQFGTQSTTATNQYNRFTRSVGNTGALRSAAGALRGIVGALGIGFGVAMVVTKLKDATRQAMAFGKAMAEVASLGVKNMGMLTNAVRDVSTRYALSSIDTAKAAYQAISAGASEFQTPLVLEKAAIAATAGVSDLTTAVTLGMAAMNAYGKSVDKIGDAFDEAFLAVKYGVTTFAELAAAAPPVFPIASALNVPSQDVMAAVAALTKGGFGTSEAITGLQGILVAIAKETPKAQKMAKELGLEFTVQGIRAKGLQQFLIDLGEATDGNAALMQKLMGRVEGTSAALALTGSQADFLNDMFGEMANKTGKAHDAFDLLVKNNPARALELVNANIEDMMINMGNHLIPLTFRWAKAVYTVQKAWVDLNGSFKTATNYTDYAIAWGIDKLADLTERQMGDKGNQEELRAWAKMLREMTGESQANLNNEWYDNVTAIDKQISGIEKLSSEYEELIRKQREARKNLESGSSAPNMVDSQALLDKIRTEGALEDIGGVDFGGMEGGSIDFSKVEAAQEKYNDALAGLSFDLSTKGAGIFGGMGQNWYKDYVKQRKELEELYDNILKEIEAANKDFREKIEKEFADPVAEIQLKMDQLLTIKATLDPGVFGRAMEALQKQMDEATGETDKRQLAENIRESVMTPVEEYNKALSEINSIADYLSPEAYNRALTKIQDDFLKASGAAEQFEETQRQIDRSRGIQMDARDVAFNGPMPIIDVSGGGQKSSDERTHQLLQQLLQYMRRDGIAPVAV